MKDIQFVMSVIEDAISLLDNVHCYESQTYKDLKTVEYMIINDCDKEEAVESLGEDE